MDTDFLLGAFLALAIGTTAFAECRDLSGAKAAQLLHNEVQDKLIGDLVSKWKSKEPARIIKFGAYVSRTGRLENACCMSSVHSMSSGASQRLGRKIALLKFSPASRMGRIESACYIPGLHNGEATAMLYSEGFVNE